MLQGLSEWRSTPPAIFAPIVGAIGLGVVWMRAGPELGVGGSPGLVIFAIAVSIYLFFLGLYGAKLVVRAGVLIEDLRIAAGRPGLTASTLSAMLTAAGVVQFAPLAAEMLLFAALLGHGALVCLFVRELYVGGSSIREVTPAWHLFFVGFIVGSQAAALLGLASLALGLLTMTFLFALAIYGASLDAGQRAALPAPMRPMLAIHLAPLSLFGTTAVMLGLSTLGHAFAIAATGVAAYLLVRLRWIVAAGFGPSWAAFTFPPVAYAGVLLMLSETLPLYRWMGGIALLLATLLVPLILARLLVFWARGDLARMTGSARA